LGDQAYKDAINSEHGQIFQKEINRGLKEAVEDSVQKSLGDDAAQALRSKNDELGRILTSKDRALIEAEKEANKNALTSIDALAGSVSLKALAMKKAADFAKMTGPRTTTGKFLYDQGRGQLSGPIWDILLRQSAIEANRDEQP
jgi:hypothetical protein